MQYVAWDIETAKITPEGADLMACRPFGICCAATLTSEGQPRLWHGDEQPDGRLAPQMSPHELRLLAIYLRRMQETGHYVLTLNGAGFDFRILADECQDPAWEREIARLALGSIDIGFAMVCEKGFMIGLQTAALGMRLPGKTEGMHGDLAPALWAQGRAEQDRVLQYVARDVETTAVVYAAILAKGYLAWTSKRGAPCSWRPWLKVDGQVADARLQTVQEGLEMPAPDTSWMAEPRPREAYVGWALDLVREESRAPNPLESWRP